MDTIGKPNWSDGRKKSELEILLERNLMRSPHLTKEEHSKACELIDDPVYSTEECWVCKMYKKDNPNYPDVRPAIYDTGLCKGHAGYALSHGI